MLPILASAVPSHWSANMLYINEEVLRFISSEDLPAWCYCVVKCSYAILNSKVKYLWLHMQHLIYVIVQAGLT